jgi:hypothetical protein
MPDENHIPNISLEFCIFTPEMLDLWQKTIKVNGSRHVPDDIDDNIEMDNYI